MTTSKFNHEANEREINDFIAAFVPFGSRDISAAIEHAVNAGHDADWASEQVTQFMDECGTTIDKIDPVYCVMDAILQEARNEIDSLTSFDFMNDGSGIDTYGNFMCTSYDYREEAKEELVEKLAEYDISLSDLEEATQYFLDQLEISQSDIDTAKASTKK